MRIPAVIHVARTYFGSGLSVFVRACATVNTRIMKSDVATLFLLAFALLSPARGSQANPIEKILEMISDLQAKVLGEGQGAHSQLCPGSVIKPGSEPGVLAGLLDLLLVLFALYGLWRLVDDVWRMFALRTRTMQTQSPVTYTSLQGVMNVKFKPLSEWEQGAWELA